MIPVAHGTTADAFLKSVGNVSIGPLNENFSQMTPNSRTARMDAERRADQSGL